MKSGQYPVVSGQWLKKTLRVLDYMASLIMILYLFANRVIYTLSLILFLIILSLYALSILAMLGTISN